MTRAISQRFAVNAPGSLAEYQQAMADAVLEPDGSSCAPNFAYLVAQPGFTVYRNTMMKGCIDALQASYPAIMRLVGEEWFRSAAACYVRAEPPHQPSMLVYGATFAQFLSTFAPAKELPYLMNVARIERFWTEAHVAADASMLAPDALAALDPEHMAQTILHLHPSARWAWFDESPIVSIWRCNRFVKSPAEIVASHRKIDWRGEGILVTRPRDAVHTIDLDAAGCAFLDACAANRSLEIAVADVLAAHPDVELAQMIARLLKAGAFTAMTHEPALTQEVTESH